MYNTEILRCCLFCLGLSAIPSKGQWTPVFSTSGVVNDLHVYDGKLYVASKFEGPLGEADHISGVYDGSNLVLPANDFPNGSIFAFATHNGQLFAGGDFERVGGPIGVGVWDGSNWSGSQYNFGPQPAVVSLCSYDGDLYIGLDHSMDLPSCVFTHDGAGYSAVGGLLGRAFSMANFNGELYAGGIYTQDIGTFVRWSGATWETAGPNLVGGAVRVLEAHNDELYLGGTFTNVNNGLPFPFNLLRYFARWDGTDLQGGGSGASCGHVTAFRSTSAGLYVATDLTYANGSCIEGIRLWNGAAWQPCGDLDPNDVVTAIEEYDGQIYIGVSNNGTHQVYRSAGQVGFPGREAQILRIGPNPASEHIQVFSNPDPRSSFQIYDQFGRVIRKGVVNDPIWIADLPSGVYTFELTAGQELHRALFIKER